MGLEKQTPGPLSDPPILPDKSKRPDRLAIRASCVTIARQPPSNMPPLNERSIRHGGELVPQTCPCHAKTWHIATFPQALCSWRHRAGARAAALRWACDHPRASPATATSRKPRLRLSRAFLPVLKESPSD